MRRRRIFTPAYHPRRWGTIAAGLAAVAALSGLAFAVPRDLFGPAAREEVLRAGVGEVRVVDGETLRMGDQLLRLSGIVAPERGRPCRDAAGRGYDCGSAAAEALARLVAGRAVECRLQGRDRMGRPLGLCTAGGVEVNASLVAAGLVMASDGTATLAPIEATAREAGRGIWATVDSMDRGRRGL